ncbi:hypothetical protein EC973_006693 [Apophysomyces ossiformis]|uniref:non-specific serine/threonine protein kinase n=1 Tax=Apophysomyces ossiformis TaxID=679940 RepID=A0A8H7EQA7_9FUNG|nr:hypothetical protein EC973_006693 [Apophysomyces ossiformis]
MRLLKSAFHRDRSDASSSLSSTQNTEESGLYRKPQSSSTSSESVTAHSPRLQFHTDGSHTHHLKRPSTGLLSLTNLLHKPAFRLPLFGNKKTPRDSAREEREAIDATLQRVPSDASSLAQKWGVCEKVIGKGAFGVVKIARKADRTGERLYAVKELRKKHSESTKHYVQRLTSEFCIASSLHQQNVIETLDLLPLNETSSVYCQVMEYCDGGDLFSLIYDSNGGLDITEADCFFKQLARGIRYLHQMGVAHRDVKPENLLLTSSGCLKLSDFGSAECFLGDHDEVLASKNICGSEPYIAPEEFIDKSYDPRAVDIWSCGVVYMAMRTGNHVWEVARENEDENYTRYLRFRRLVDEESEKARRRRNACKYKSNEEEFADIVRTREEIRKKAQIGGLDILEHLESRAKRLIYRMLDPNPRRRARIDDVINNEWIVATICCQAP